MSAGSRAHVDFDPTEIRSVAGDRIYQGEECDPLGSCIRREEAELCRPHFWAGRYFVSTVRREHRDTEVIREYIKKQEEEDKRLEQMKSVALMSHLQVAHLNRGRVSDPDSRFDRLIT
jgi:Transposase IS200 like